MFLRHSLKPRQILFGPFIREGAAVSTIFLRTSRSRSFLTGLFALLLTVGSTLIVGCEGRPGDRSAFIPPAGKYDVRILRDNWGVPHIFGKRDADVAYGLAYAHCEDDWATIEEQMLLVRGRMASVLGREFAKFDYLVHWFRVREFVDARFETDLSPELRSLLDAYADGINHFAALHPEKMPHLELPVTARDIVAGATLKAPFFYRLDNYLKSLFEDDRAIPIDHRGQIGMNIPEENPFTRGLAMGSNAWAVGPSRSADGATRLAINSHQPWTGPVTWYEAHVRSEEGWNMIGGTFPAAPLIFKGHDENKGWCHTINQPDLADIYRLTINPENPNQYLFDGQWLDLERGMARINVRLWGRLSWTFSRELLWSVHGPAVRRADGVFAIRFAGYGEVRQLEQWYRMNKARNLDEFLAAMRMGGLSSLNTLYADRQGNIYYAYNGQFPVRNEGYDWHGILPGDTSETLWTTFHPFDSVPQLLNPPSGFAQNCNNSPYYTTDGDGNPRPEDFPETMGIQSGMTNRGWRALETYGADPAITREEFYAYKYDKVYSEKSGPARFQAAVREATIPDEPLLQEAAALLTGWDRSTDKNNRAAALAVLASGAYVEGQAWREGSDDIIARLRRAAELLMEKHGRLDVPWQDVMRLQRGELDLGLGGGMDCLRALDPSLQEDGRFKAVNGDCYFLMVEWTADGRMVSEGIHQFGAATIDANSPHYADQAPLFAVEETRPTLFYENNIRANLKREYRPGEFHGPWYLQ